MKVTDGVYAYIWKEGFENNCNTFFFGAPLNILFDPGLKNRINVHQKQMKDDGVDPENVEYLVNTHCHPDHFEGTMSYIEKGAKTVMHKDEIEFFKKEGPLFFQMFNMPFPKIDFDVVLEEGIWKVGDTELQIFHTPGHSPGSVCIYWAEKKTMVCGDLIFDSSFGRVDFPGGSPAKLKESIRKISKLDIEILLPGHMGMITGKENVQKNFRLVEQYFPQI